MDGGIAAAGAAAGAIFAGSTGVEAGSTDGGGGRTAVTTATEVASSSSTLGGEASTGGNGAVTDVMRADGSAALDIDGSAGGTEIGVPCGVAGGSGSSAIPSGGAPWVS